MLLFLTRLGGLLSLSVNKSINVAKVNKKIEFKTISKYLQFAIL